MLAAKEPDLLVQHCRDLKEKGNLGVLISGGCDRQGRLPWDRFGEAIESIKEKTGLYISVHSGLVDYPTALRLKHAGVDQALIDVIGDEETLQRVYHVDYGVSSIVDSLEALEKAQLSVIPHIVCGLHYGIMKGESNALDLLTAFEVKQLVIVSLMNIPRTPFARIKPPATEEVMDIVLEARTKLPQTIISLGCARQRGNNLLETLAVDAGVNRMALPSEEAIQRAKDHGLEIRYQRTCCSVSTDSSSESW
jgi:uncharacterized radical SAM superfamily protein